MVFCPNPILIDQKERKETLANFPNLFKKTSKIEKKIEILFGFIRVLMTFRILVEKHGKMNSYHYNDGSKTENDGQFCLDNENKNTFIACTPETKRFSNKIEILLFSC